MLSTASQSVQCDGYIRLAITLCVPLSSVPSAAPPTTAASDAMSILDTITSLNQGASSWAGPSGEKGRKGLTSEEPMQPGEKGDHDMVIAEEGDHSQDGQTADEAEEAKLALELQAVDIKTEESQVESSKEEGEAGEVGMKEEETNGEEGEKDGGQEQQAAEEEKDKAGGRTGKSSAEKQDEDDSLKCPNQIRQKARERLKEGEQSRGGRCCRRHTAFIYFNAFNDVLVSKLHYMVNLSESSTSNLGISWKRHILLYVY